MSWLVAFLGIAALWTIAVAAVRFAPWVPTRSGDFERIFRLAGLKPGERFVDLGCGDGRMVIEAARRGAGAEGVELAVPLYAAARLRQALSGQANARVRWGDLFGASLAEADVIFLFGHPKTLAGRLREKLERELKPGARVLSYVFKIDGWTPTAVDDPGPPRPPLYLYRNA